jgi:hypothetical protein
MPQAELPMSLARPAKKKEGSRFVGALGLVLVLGGLAHTFGVSRLYVTSGVPDVNRVLLDVWIAEAQIVGGALFLVGRKRGNPRSWFFGAAILVWTWAIPFLPVLIHRAKPIFWVMPTLYSVASAVAVRRARRQAAKS